jgi:hypothetical protein
MAKKKRKPRKPRERPKTQLQQVLHDFAVGVRKLGCNKGFRYSCFYDLVDDNGQLYYPQPFPKKKYRKGIPKHCYMNAALLVFEHPRSLIYVEGFILPTPLPVPIPHAWCVHKKDPRKVIDPTLDDALEYFGIPFDYAYLSAQWEPEEGEDERCSASLIDNVEDGFPLMRMTEEELAEVIDPTGRKG